MRSTGNGMTDTDHASLIYTLICDDVRIEMGNKMSLMGIFQNIVLPQFPATVIKFAVVNHWEGAGTYTSELRVVGPGGRETVRSRPTSFKIGIGGRADNVTFFTNVTFQTPGAYTIQVVLSGEVVGETQLQLRQLRPEPTMGAIN